MNSRQLNNTILNASHNLLLGCCERGRKLLSVDRDNPLGLNLNLFLEPVSRYHNKLSFAVFGVKFNDGLYTVKDPDD